MPKTILVVDDEPQILRLLTPVFQQRGLRVLTASNVAEAIGILNRNAPAVVVSDLRMPGGDGTELLALTRTLDHHVPVVLMTGFSDLKVEDALQQGAEALIAKPFSLREMVAIVDRALANAPAPAVTIAVHVEVKPRQTPVDEVDLNHGGMFVPLSGTLPTELDRVHLKFHFQGGQMPPLEGTAQVRWVQRQSRPGHPRGVGVEFISLPAESRRRVLRMAQIREAKASFPANSVVTKKAG